MCSVNDLTQTYVIDTPESVHKEEYHDSPLYCDTKVEYQDSSCSDPKDEYDVQDNSNFIPEDSINLETKSKEYNVMAYEDSDTQDSDDSRLSDKITTYRSGPRPIHRSCSYCVKVSPKCELYQCDKDRCRRKICDLHVSQDYHKRHTKYLTNYDTGHPLDPDG